MTRQFAVDHAAGLTTHLRRLQIRNTHPQQLLAAVAHEIAQARVDLEYFIIGAVQ